MNHDSELTTIAFFTRRPANNTYYVKTELADHSRYPQLLLSLALYRIQLVL